MSEIQITVQDRSGQRTAVTLPTNVSAQQAAQMVRDWLHLPVTDHYDRHLTYIFFHAEEGRLLNAERTLPDNHVAPGDRLRILHRPFNRLFELELLTDPNPGMLFPVGPREASIGREFGNSIIIRHKVISRKHGVLEWMNGLHVYLDLDSANGSWINDQPVTEMTPITDGDILSLGQSIKLIYRERYTGLDPTTEDSDAIMASIDIHDSRTSLTKKQSQDIYISFSPDQQHLAERLAEALEKVRLRVYLSEEEMLDSVRLMVVLLSPTALQSREMMVDWRYFLSEGRPIIPVVLEGASLPDELVHMPYVVYHDAHDGNLAFEVADAIFKHMA